MAGAPLSHPVTQVDQTGTIAQPQPWTPPRRMGESAEEDYGLLGFTLLVAQSGPSTMGNSATSQPAGSGGVISINHTNMVANTLREEMHAVRSDLEAKFNAMKIEFEIKMSGRKGTGHWESGAIETLIEKNNIVEQKMEDIHKNMDTIKDIKELIENDEKITGMIKKYKEIIIEGTLNTHVINVTKKLKDELDKNFMGTYKMIETIEEDMNKMKEDTSAGADMPSLTPLPGGIDQKIKDHLVQLQSVVKLHEEKIEDNFKNKFEELFDLKLQGKIGDFLQDVTRMNAIFQENVMMNLKHHEKEEGETRGDKGGQGKANNTSSVKTPNDGEGSSPQNIIPTQPPGIAEAVGAGILARSPRANGESGWVSQADPEGEAGRGHEGRA